MPYRFGSGWHGTSSARPCSARDPRHRVVARCRALQATRQTRTVDRSVKSQESPPRISSPRTRKDDTATSENPQFRVLVTTPAAADTVGQPVELDTVTRWSRTTESPFAREHHTGDTFLRPASRATSRHPRPRWRTTARFGVAEMQPGRDGSGRQLGHSSIPTPAIAPDTGSDEVGAHVLAALRNRPEMIGHRRAPATPVADATSGRQTLGPQRLPRRSRIRVRRVTSGPPTKSQEGERRLGRCNAPRRQ